MITTDFLGHHLVGAVPEPGQGEGLWPPTAHFIRARWVQS